MEHARPFAVADELVVSKNIDEPVRASVREEYERVNVREQQTRYTVARSYGASKQD